MRFWVGLTDREWFDFLAARAPLDEVNFWQPSPRRPVHLAVGAPFLFKLHAAHGGWIVGGGYYAHFTTLPATLAWDAFQENNGASSFHEMAGRVRRYRQNFDVVADQIGCVALVEPFFLPRELWIPPPPSWRAPTQVGRRYETTEPDGAMLWRQVEEALAAISAPSLAVQETLDLDHRYGEPTLRPVRLGQGTFRTKIIDAYERRCVVTDERTLPVLEAAHIKPYSRLGPHASDNGLLLRSDLHTLFDQGYLSVAPDLRVLVSRTIREQFDNGRDYYALSGREVRLPAAGNPPPSREYLEWHADTVFRG
ncbi:MAG TPA: HNH endonuclease [Nonomuraea sp.]|nr:HNH endonuclease [Nonomuraea sp.]